MIRLDDGSGSCSGSDDGSNDDEIPFWSETGMSMTMMMAPLRSTTECNVRYVQLTVEQHRLW